MSRILVTGAGGFIGREVVLRLLGEGHEIHALGRTPGEDREGLRWHSADLLAPGCARDITAAAEAEMLIHLAWYATPGSFWTAPENELWVSASLALLRAFAEAGGRRAVMAGTCAEYRWGEARLSEGNTPLEPASLYGRSKQATHEAACLIAEELGVSLAWGRIFFLYGAREDPRRLVAAVARGLLAGEEVPSTSGTQRRDFMHVADVAGAFAALLASEVTGPVNIASGHAVPVREIVELIGRASGAPELLRIGALPQRAGEPDVIEGDDTRLRSEVGFHAQIGLEQGIAAVLEELRDEQARADASRGR